MNFKKYHVSRNLWDEDYTGINSSAIYRPLFVGDGVFTLSTNFKANSGITDIFLLSGNVSSGINSSVNGAYEGMSITAQSVNGYITIAYRAYARPTSGSLPYCKTMLNTGSQPLPYEPYSSEVWHDIPHYIHKTATDIITTLPADIYPNAATATVGLKGQTVQNGTPTPQNPVMPNGCGKKTGNLFDEVYADITTYPVHYKAIYVGDGNFTLSTNCPISSDSIACLYFLTGNVSEGASTQTNGVYEGRSITVSATNGYVTIGYRTRESINPNNYNTMLNTGSTALPYQPFGVKIPISSASTTTPVYLGEVESTRRIKQLVLTGNEAIEIKSGNAKWYIPIADMKTPTNTSVIEWYCSHYQAVANNASWTSYDYMISWSTADSGSSIGLRIRDIDFLTGVTVDDFKSYLAQQYAAGTPVTVWYVLATPETAVVNEPIRKIGDYADEVSGITIPITAGGDSISVDTTLQPSEVSVNYKGWHPAIVHEHTNGAWT